MPRQSDPITQFILPYHPAYGLDDNTRVEVLRLVVDWQVKPAEAARIHNLGVSTVYRWLAAARRINITNNSINAIKETL